MRATCDMLNKRSSLRQLRIILNWSIGMTKRPHGYDLFRSHVAREVVPTYWLRQQQCSYPLVLRCLCMKKPFIERFLRAQTWAEVVTTSHVQNIHHRIRIDTLPWRTSLDVNNPGKLPKAPSVAQQFLLVFALAKMTAALEPSTKVHSTSTSEAFGL